MVSDTNKKELFQKKLTKAAIHPNENILAQEHAFVQLKENTLDLRGKRVEEALSALQFFLDQCQRKQESFCWVIHGHGSQQIKKGIREYASTTKEYSLSIRKGELSEGGDGVTLFMFT
jgi:DNA mismatch repair protein MutS2